MCELRLARNFWQGTLRHSAPVFEWPVPSWHVGSDSVFLAHDCSCWSLQSTCACTRARCYLLPGCLFWLYLCFSLRIGARLCSGAFVALRAAAENATESTTPRCGHTVLGACLICSMLFLSREPFALTTRACPTCARCIEALRARTSVCLYAICGEILMRVFIHRHRKSEHTGVC